MKTILAYGDSLTWGSDPETGLRHPPDHRWPDVLQGSLGDQARVISDGMRGRTTAYDDHLADCDRNGVRLLPSALYSHAPIDLVIIMLGSNDMKPAVAGKAIAAAQGMRRLAEIAQSHDQGLDAPPRVQVLLVAPPPLVETELAEFAAMFEGGVAEAQKMAAMYQTVAEETGCGFFDAGTVAKASPVDGVHLDREATRSIGKALVPVVASLLQQGAMR